MAYSHTCSYEHSGVRAHLQLRQRNMFQQSGIARTFTTQAAKHVSIVLNSARAAALRKMIKSRQILSREANKVNTA